MNLLQSPRILAASVALSIILGCTGCAHGPFPLTNDGNATEAQQIMMQTVQVVVVLDVTGPDEKGEIAQDTTQARGTGTIVGKKNIHDKSKENTVETLIVTAAHVSHAGAEKVIVTPDGPYLITGSSMHIVTLTGQECDAREITMSEEADVGFIVAECDAGDVAPLANELPPVGARVEYAGCPRSFHIPGSFPFFDGRYTGSYDPKEDEELPPDGPTVQTTAIPGAPGSSGSGLYYRGKVYGLINKKMDGLETFVMGATVMDIRDGLKHIKQEHLF